MQHSIKRRRPFVNDDVYLAYNPQSSSQWDGFTHYGNATYQGFYNGVTEAQVTGGPDTRNGIHIWARQGIAGRAVLIDYQRWASSQGIAYSPGERHEITAEALRATARAQGIQFQPGDILLVRSGWIAWYMSLEQQERKALAETPHTAVGLAQGEETLRFLWDEHFAAVAGDTIAFEAYPAHPTHGFMHETLLALWGMPIGELFDLEALAEDCAADGIYEGFLTSAPLNTPGGVASPPNALMVK